MAETNDDETQLAVFERHAVAATVAAAVVLQGHSHRAVLTAAATAAAACLGHWQRANEGDPGTASKARAVAAVRLLLLLVLMEVTVIAA